MANTIFRISCFCVLTTNLFVINVIAYSVGSLPLCGTKDGSIPSKDSQQIYFKDKDKGVKTIETNGAIIGCYPTEPEVGVPIPRSFIPDVAKCAEENQTYCTKNDEYPLEYVNFLLRKHKRMLAFAFGSDSIANADKREFDVRINRIKRQIHEKYLCDSQETIIYPESGKTSNGTELFILNTPEHRQGVSVSLCSKTGQSCQMTDVFPKNIRTECQQHFVYRELLALSPDGVPIKAKFEFPAYCKCAVIHRRS